MFEIYEYNLSHLLGINFKNIITYDGYNDALTEVLGLDKTQKISSYELLLSILNNYEEVARYDEQARYKILNYYKSMIKCSIFEKITAFQQFNFGKLLQPDNSILLYTPSNEALCPYFLMRLSRNEDEEKYGASSLLALKISDIENYFSMPASIPTQIVIDDNKKLSKINATPSDKRLLLSNGEEFDT